jgi:hypothetical protein
MFKKLKYIGHEDNLKKRISSKYINKRKINYSLEVSMYQKKEEYFYKNKRANFYKIVDRINEIRGKRWAKYPLFFRKIIDYKYNLIPITYSISGVNSKETYNLSNEEITPYCYNDNNVCPFWRNDISNGIIYCDAYNTFNSEVDNSKKAYISAMKKFKTFNNLDKVNTCMALFDMVDICNFKWELSINET